MFPVALLSGGVDDGWSICSLHAGGIQEEVKRRVVAFDAQREIVNLMVGPTQCRAQFVVEQIVRVDILGHRVGVAVVHMVEARFESCLEIIDIADARAEMRVLQRQIVSAAGFVFFIQRKVQRLKLQFVDKR